MITFKSLTFLMTTFAVMVVSASGTTEEKPLIQSAFRRAEAEAMYKTQRVLAENRASALFGVMNGNLSPAERDALTFLYAYMPLQDMADYDGSFFLKAVKATLSARSEMPWGEEIPEDVFLSFVLPLRVNNENLDDARPELFQALKDRVKDLTLGEAILEINHWCHEKATYRATDARTSSPMSTIRTGWGRCGEESVLTVAALRSVGIPARQVYTPRWAHVDDNHAWVEAWVDGKWHYLGACEPEPMLDMAWFREPVRRAMMVHTKGYGGSRTGEYKIHGNRYYDELQVLSGYAPVVERNVRVVDSADKPVPSATVEFGLYNYAEFYPLASIKTDASGCAMLQSGKGDLRIWVYKGNQAGSGILAADADEIVIKLAPMVKGDRTEFLDIHPPPEPMPILPEVTREAREANRRRLGEESRKREAYMASFAQEEQSATWAEELDLDPEQLWSFLQKSQGNHAEIMRFLKSTPEEKRHWAMALLGTVSEKDFRDTPASVLKDHLDGVVLDEADELPMEEKERFISFVMSPRIHNELLTPWRSGLQNYFGADEINTIRRNPSVVVNWINTKIKINTEANWLKVPMRPMGIIELKVADELGRSILFVAICRAAGVPARLEPATLAPQFFQGAWKTVNWGGHSAAKLPTGSVIITGRMDTEPVYMSHFALARLKDGSYQTLDYYGKPWKYFQDGLSLEPGAYCLTTGNRQDDGSVLVRQTYFDLGNEEVRVLPLVMRPSKPAPPPLGEIDLDVALPSIPLIEPSESDTGWEEGQPHALSLLSDDKGLILAWLGIGDEPTRHAMVDLEQLREPIEKWGGGLVLFLQELPKGESRYLDKITDMSQQTKLLLDSNGTLLAQIQEAIKRQPTDQFPVIMGVSKGGKVIYYSEGYRIGVGEQVLKAIRRMGNM
jgi:transglutaminase-like putative cysteine protease